MSELAESIRGRLISPRDYIEVARRVESLNRTQRLQAVRVLCRTDLFWLFAIACGNDWVFKSDKTARWVLTRCREVQASPNGHLDLWSREHFKSSIITFTLTIQDILRGHGEGADLGYEPTFGFFSFSRPIAQAFMIQIMTELENNDLLKDAFPDILWENPKREAARWGVDSGIVVKRKGNPKEQTIEAWGLVDGMPVSKHYTHRIYDDVVTKDSVTTAEQVQKVITAWELSLSLANSDVDIERYVGTRYAYADPYRAIMDRAAVAPRIYPATHNGQFDGDAVMWSQEQWTEKARKAGPRTSACQHLQDPKLGETNSLKRSFLRYYTDHHNGAGMWIGIFVDPANAKKKESDYTGIAVIGCSADRNYYLLDAIRDKLSLKERTEALIALHREWSAEGKVQYVGYEKYGKDADIEHIRGVQDAENYRFEINELGGRLSKLDRIDRIIPDLAAGRWWFPSRGIWRTTWQGGAEIDVMNLWLLEEYDPYPLGRFDLLDAMTRIYDEAVQSVLAWPKPQTVPRSRYARPESPRQPSWRAL